MQFALEMCPADRNRQKNL